MDKIVYFDHAASTPVIKSARDVLTESILHDFANSSAAHKLGRDIAKRIDRCRESFKQMLSCKDGEILFTSSATESNNLVIKGIRYSKDDIIFVSMADHPSLVAPVRRLEKDYGVTVRPIPLLIGGEINQEELLREINKKTKLVILSQVNNSSGHILDVNKLSRKIKERYDNTYIHVDGVQSFCKIEFSLDSAVINSYSISSHKLGGPKGVAAIYLNNRLLNNVSPALEGGGHEFGVRSSTLAAPLIFSFEAAASFNFKHLKGFLLTTKKIKKYFISLLQDYIDNVIIISEDRSSSPYIVQFILPGVSSDIIVRHLEVKKIYVSTSSACSSKNKGNNAIYLALGIASEYHKFVLRASFSPENTIEEVEFFCREISLIYKKLIKIKVRR